MSQSAPGRREVAYRLFAAEFDDSEYSYSESDEERAPNYVVTPTGARVNRLFAVGVLTEIEDVNPEMVRGRIVDPTGAFVTYAGQYQPDALGFLERVDPPTFLALSGKARTYEPEDGDRIYTSVRPESVSEVDAETRDRWVVTAAERTLERIGIVASAIESGMSGDALETALSEAGVEDRLAEGVALALDYYGTTPAYLDALRELSVDAVRVVAGERDEVGRLELDPGEGNGDASALATIDLPSPGSSTSAEPAAEDAEAAESATLDTDEADAVDVDSEAPSSAESESGPDIDSEPVSDQKATEPAESAVETDSTSIEERTAESETSAEETISEADVASVEEELDDFDPGEFELDEEERREVEEEFGTEFSTAGEVESPESGSEPDTETESMGDSESVATSAADSETEPAAESEPEGESEPEPTASSESEPEEIDLTDAVMATMEQLDEGDGADKATLVETVADERGVSADAVEEAIQDALMSGRCYEPADGTLKSI